MDEHTRFMMSPNVFSSTLLIRKNDASIGLARTIQYVTHGIVAGKSSNVCFCTAYIYTVPANPKNDAYMEMTGGQFKLKVSVLDG